MTRRGYIHNTIIYFGNAHDICAHSQSIGQHQRNVDEIVVLFVVAHQAVKSAYIYIMITRLEAGAYVVADER